MVVWEVAQNTLGAIILKAKEELKQCGKITEEGYGSEITDEFSR